MKKTGSIFAVAVFALLLTGAGILAEGEKTGTEKEEVKVQASCPVMGGKINKKLYADVKGKRIYVCCPGCVSAIKKNPDKYIEKLEDKGVTIEKTPVWTCSMHPDIKESEPGECPKCGMKLIKLVEKKAEKDEHSHKKGDSHKH